MSDQKVNQLSNEELNEELNKLYKKSSSNVAIPDRINILLAEKSWRESRDQNEANSKVSKNYLTIVKFALIISIMMMIIAIIGLLVR